MRVDLERVLSASDDCLQSRSILAGVMRDFYPEEKREVNILLNAFESGAPSAIARQGTLSKEEYRMFLKRIMDKYAMQEYYAMQALDAWVDVLLGSGTAAGIREPVSVEPQEAQASAESEGFTYQEVTRGYAVTAYTGAGAPDLLIPDTYLGKPVVRIAKEAFGGCLSIKHLFLGKHVKMLETAAFRGCRNLRAVYGAEQLEYIGELAFADCENLVDIHVSDRIYYLGRQAFSNTALTSFELPGSLDYISAFLFRACHKLESVVIHDRVIALGAGCFMGCDRLDRVVIPAGVKYIGQSAFQNCRGMRLLTMEASLSVSCGSGEESRIFFQREDTLPHKMRGGFGGKLGNITDPIGIMVKLRWKHDATEKKQGLMQAIEESGEVIVEHREGESIIIFKTSSRNCRNITDRLLREYFNKRERNSPEPFVVPYTKERLVGKF